MQLPHGALRLPALTRGGSLINDPEMSQTEGPLPHSTLPFQTVFSIGQALFTDPKEKTKELWRRAGLGEEEERTEANMPLLLRSTPGCPILLFSPFLIKEAFPFTPNEPANKAVKERE